MQEDEMIALSIHQYVQAIIRVEKVNRNEIELEIRVKQCE